MSRLRVPVDGLGPGPRKLDEQAAHYVVRVHRLRAGDGFVAFDPSERTEADASILQSAPRTVVCEIGPLRAATLLAETPIVLLQGVPKGETLDQIVRDATELGATRIVPVVCARCGPAARRIERTRLARWDRIARQAARQSGRGDVPSVGEPVSLAAALGAIGVESLRLCLWERATTPLRRVLTAEDKLRAVALLVGPEGGLDDTEVELAVRSGFEAVSLGRFILRTETASTAALGAIVAWTTR
jgi:16S rRNA (uracil1498-N3)-methyltransferase